jgi:hypothetical protein
MLCEFENIPCAISGNFTCKKCKTCGHQIGMATSVVNERWGEINAEIALKCSHRLAAAQPDPAPPVPAPEPQPLPPQQITPEPVQPPTPQPVEEQPQLVEDMSGPGGHLKKYLSRVGIKASPNCSCNARARYMDFMGTTWCENNIDTIVGWLKEESEKRGLPFFDWPARTLVKKAISSSKKVQAKQFKKQNTNDVQPPTA